MQDLDTRNQIIRTLWRARVPEAEIGRIFGLSRQRVSQIVVDERKRVEEMVAEIRGLLSSGQNHG